jgi:hypothetical protein
MLQLLRLFSAQLEIADDPEAFARDLVMETELPRALVKLLGRAEVLRLF